MTDFLPEAEFDVTGLVATPDQLESNQRQWKTLLSKCNFEDAPVYPNLPPLIGQCWIIRDDQVSVVNERKVIQHSNTTTVMYTNRFAWMHHKGLNDVPKTNLNGVPIMIRHLCNMPDCINPNHLRSGTALDNADDARKTLRHQKGDVSDETVRMIRESLYDADHPDYLSATQRAEKFGVSQSTVNDIDQGIGYTYVVNEDGSQIDQSKVETRREQKRKRREMNQNTVWTKDDWERAAQYLLDNSQVDEEHGFQGIPCRKWNGSKKTYPLASVNGVTMGAHVIAAFIGNNFEAPDPTTPYACHECHNHMCVEPKHLIFGHHQDNMEASSRDGKLGRKLTADQVIEMRRLFYQGRYGSPVLAEKYGVDQVLVSKIMQFKLWKHATNEEIELLYKEFVLAGCKMKKVAEHRKVRRIREAAKTGPVDMAKLKRETKLKTAQIQAILDGHAMTDVVDDIASAEWTDPRQLKRDELRQRSENKAKERFFIHQQICPPRPTKK